MSGVSPDFLALLSSVGERPDDRDVLTEVCRACVPELGVDGAGLTMIVGGQPQGTLGASDGRFAAVEELQFTAGEGPCVDAHASGTMVGEAALASTSRWSGFAPGAVQRGVEAVYAFPLQVGRARLGALDLYRFEPGRLSPHAYGEAQGVAERITNGLVTLLADAAPGTVPTAMTGSTDGAVVHQAAGMVSVQMDVSVADALVALRARAYVTGSRVSEIAARVVERHLRFDGDRNGDGTTGR